MDAEDAENSCGSRGLHIKVEAYPDEESTDDNSLDAVPPVYLRSIKENIQKSITRELPFNVPFRAKVALVEQFYADWHRYCQTCFDSIYGATLTELQMLVDHHFTQFNATALLDHVRLIVEWQVEISRQRTQERIK